MATTVTRLDNPHDGQVRLYKWVLASGETGDPVDLGPISDVSVNAWGTFGAAVTLEGSNDPDGDAGSWVGLTDQAGTAISMTAKSMEQVLQTAQRMRPVAGAVTSVTVILRVVK